VLIEVQLWVWMEFPFMTEVNYFCFILRKIETIKATLNNCSRLYLNGVTLNA